MHILHCWHNIGREKDEEKLTKCRVYPIQKTGKTLQDQECCICEKQRTVKYSSHPYCPW